jgi:hypothetical protein
MNNGKSPIVIILSSIVLVTAVLSGIFESYSGLLELINKTFAWLNIELRGNSSSFLLIVLIIILLALFYHLVKRAKKNVSVQNQKEDRIRQVYLKWLGKDLQNRLKSNLHCATFIIDFI